MSLSKQMILFITSILLILLLGTFALNFHNTKTFLEHQLESHAQDTATSLGLSLSSVADAQDPSTMETMINAVFDRGYYAQISLYDVDGKLTYQRLSSKQIEGIPDWFINSIPVKAPKTESLIQSGWIPMGKLVVQSHPGYAYVELWKTAISLSIWFLFAAIIAILIAYYALRIMLTPLKKLEQQAQAIVKKEYLLQDELPNTTEFKQVVSAMNTMVHKMKDVFDRDARIAEKLQKMAYQDSVTGLSNRLHFEMNIDTLLDPKNDTAGGIMVLLRVESLKEINDQCGYLIGDKFMKMIAESLCQHLLTQNGLAARLNGTELICVIPETSADQVIQQAKRIQASIEKVVQTLNIDPSLSIINLGITDYQPGQLRSELLPQLDFAVTEAHKLGNNELYYVADTTGNADDKIWQEVIQSAIDEKRFVLFQQGTYTESRSIHSSEILVRLKDSQGEIHSAGYFMPAVKRLHKEVEIDRLVVNLTLHHLASQTVKLNEKLSINLTRSFCKDTSLQQWLFKQIAQVNPAKLAFEIPEHLINTDGEAARSLLQALGQMGFEFGIDNFGSQFGQMTFLQEIRPDFIKLDAAFSHVIEKDEQTRSYVSSLVEMCKSLDILIIAMAVETESQKVAFQQLGIHVFQGYLYGAPKPLLTL